MGALELLEEVADWLEAVVDIVFVRVSPYLV
jgi:hypothetical protein